MKFFTYPQDIKLRDRLSGKEGETVSFRTIAIGRWANDAKAADSVAKLTRWIKIVDKLDAGKPGDLVVLEDEDHKSLCDVSERDRASMLSQPLICAQLAPFYDAVSEAKTYEGEKAP